MKDRIIFGSLLSIGLLATPAAFACATDGWDDFTGGGVAGSPTTINRYSEFCALRMTGMGHVQDDSPSHTDMIARFYVLPQLTGSGDAKLFTANKTAGGTAELFNVSYDGTNFNFDATAGGGTSTAFAAPTGWSLIEVAYSAGGASSFWVNADATTDAASGSFTAGSGGIAIEFVQLGLPAGLGGFSGGGVNYDAYESHATTPVGPLLVADANGDEAINVLDLGIVRLELLSQGGRAVRPRRRGRPMASPPGSDPG